MNHATKKTLVYIFPEKDKNSQKNKFKNKILDKHLEV